ncbi:MAG: hypothetical protein LQ349_002137 [Xanthoria aureola]|nr:MAG: hypothetical protein LQ349_002137 [Xanthoria aureola]
MDRIEKFTIPYDHEITQAIESILARLSAAAGLDHIDRQVYSVISSSEALSGSALSWLLFGPFLQIVPAALLIQELRVLVAIPLITCVAIAMALSRDRESDADYIGMLLMTEAGFHPRGAVTVFRKLKALNEKSKQLTPQREAQESEFLSTHPHDATRIQQNSMWIPEVLEIVGRVPGYRNHLVPGIRRRDGGSTGGDNDALTDNKRMWKDFLDTRDRRKPQSLPRKDRSHKPLFEDQGWENLEEFSFRLV